MSYKRKTNNVKIGNVKKKKSAKNSTTRRINRKKRSTRIRIVLTLIPIKIEKRISPCLYSFLIGLKNVFTKREREKSCRNALFTDSKNRIISSGLSTYQNLKNTIGKNNTCCITIVLLVYGV